MPTVTYTADMARLRKMLQPSAYRRLLVAGMTELGALLLPVLRSEAPEGSGPGAGTLKREMRFEVREQGSVVELLVYGPDYAKYVVGGTKPHIIEAHGGALAFEWGSRGLVFFKRVQHPGTKPNDFVGRAWGIVRETALAKLLASVLSPFRTGR